MPPSLGARARAPLWTPFRKQARPLSDDLLDRPPPASSVSTARAGHPNPLTCDAKLAATQWSPPDAHPRGLHSPSGLHSPPNRRSAPGCAVESTGPTHLQRRPRRERHGFGRPPGNCRERRRTGGGFGDGYSAARSRAASASCSGRSRCSGGRCGGVGWTIGASVLEWVRSPAPSLAASPSGALTRPTSRQALQRLRPSSRETGTRAPVPTRMRKRRCPRTSGPWAPARSAVGGQLAIMAWRSLSDSSFVPRSAALLCAHARIAGWAPSSWAPAVVCCPSVVATWVR